MINAVIAFDGRLLVDESNFLTSEHSKLSCDVLPDTEIHDRDDDSFRAQSTRFQEEGVLSDSSFLGSSQIFGDFRNYHSKMWDSQKLVDGILRPSGFYVYSFSTLEKLSDYLSRWQIDLSHGRYKPSMMKSRSSFVEIASDEIVVIQEWLENIPQRFLDDPEFFEQIEEIRYLSQLINDWVMRIS